MASGSQNMTTYNARTVTGSDSAASPAGALLLSGAGRADDATGDTWIFLDSSGGTSTPWGIKHDQANNKIQIFGAGTNSVWTEMDTGNTYIGGSLNTGSTLTVRAQDDAHEGGEIILSPATDSFSTVHIDAYDSIFRLHDGTNERFKVDISTGNATINGNLGIGADYAVLGGSYKLYVNGSTYFNGDTTHNGIDYFANGTTYYINNSAVAYLNDLRSDKVRLVDNWIGFYQNANAGDSRYGYISADADRMYFRKENGVSSFHFDYNGHLFTTGNFYSNSAGPWLELRNSDYANHTASNNGLTAYRESGVRFYRKDAGAWLGDMGQQYNTNGNISMRMYLRNYKTDGTQVNNYIYLYANKDGTTSYAIANQSAFRSAISAPSTTGSGASGTWGISITGNAATWAGLTSRWNHNTSDTWIPVRSNNNIDYVLKTEIANSATAFVKKSGDTMTSTLTLSGGSIYVQQGSVWAGTNGNTSGERQVGCQSGAGTLYMYSQAATNASRGIYGSNHAGTYTSYLYIQQDNYVRAGTRLYGAVWNDYAEFRLGQMNGLKPGQIVTENGDGTMCLASKRLQKGCKVLSDTYGFALGETNEYKLPIAVSGRVLVYCDTPIEELEPGDCLCSNVTGNTVKMTREEIINYPDCIIGTVSEIPTYNIWHCGDQTNENGMKEEVWVNGRIWIYVR